MSGQSDASCGRQRLVRAQAMSGDDDAVEDAGEPCVGGRKIRATRCCRRSGGRRRPRGLRTRGRRTGGTPRQRRKTGRSGSSSGCTTLAGAAARGPFSRMRIVSAQTCRPLARREDVDVDVARRARPRLSGCGKRTIVREGCRSARPASTSSAASTHSGGTHAVWVMTLVRWIRRVRARRDAQRRHLALDLADRRSVLPPCPPVALHQLVRGGGPQVPAG